MCDPKAVLPQQRPVKVTCDEIINAAVRKITSDANCDLNIFKKVREFFFQLPPNDFDKYAKPVHIPLFMTLCNTLEKPITDQNKEYLQAFKTNLLSILCFLGFKFTDTISFSSINIIAKQIVECSVSDLFYYIGIIQNSFEEKQNPLFEQRRGKALDIIFLNLAARFQTILKNIENFGPDECIIIVNILAKMLSYVKKIDLMSSIFAKLYPTFEMIMNYEIPKDCSFQHKFTILLLKDKCGILLGNVALNPKNPPDKVSKMTRMYSDIMKQSLIAEDVCSSFLYFIRQDEVNRIKEAAQMLPKLYNFKNYNIENSTHINSLIHFIVKDLYELRIITKLDVINFFKFEAGVLHYSQYHHQYGIYLFKTHLELIKYTNEDYFLKSKLLSIMFSAIDTGFAEMSMNVRNITPGKGNKVNPVMFWTKMRNASECFGQMVKLFQKFLCDLFPKEFIAKPTLKSSIDIQIKVNVLDVDIIYSCFIRGLMFLTRFTFFYEKGIEVIKKSVYDEDNEINVKNSANNQLLRRSHLIAARELYASLKIIPSFMVHNIWDMFLHEFYKMQEPIFDIYFFGVVITNQFLTESFLHSLTNYTINTFKKGYGVFPVINSSLKLFERLMSKKQNGSRTPDFFQKIKTDGQLYIKCCKKLIHSTIFCSKVINLIIIFCKFIDFLINMANFPSLNPPQNRQQVQGNHPQNHAQSQNHQQNYIQAHSHQQHVVHPQTQQTAQVIIPPASYPKQFSSFIFTDHFIEDILISLNSVGAPSYTICIFMEYAITIQPDVVKNKFVQTCIINAAFNNIEEALPLLEHIMEKSSRKFLTHPLIPQFYSSVHSKLDSINDVRIKERILRILSVIPQKVTEAPLEIEPFKASTQETFIFNINDRKISVECYPLIRSFQYALETSPNNENIWEIGNKLIKVILECGQWTLTKRNYLCDILTMTLFIREKDKERCDALFLKLIEDNKEDITIIAHVLSAICSYFENPPENLISPIIALLDTKEKVSNLMNEASLIPSMKRTISSLCKVIAKEVNKDKISPVTFALLVHKAIMNNFSTDWKESQKSDKQTDFIELDFTPRDLQDIIIFARDLLADNEESLIPILTTMKTSSAFFSILVQSELLSRCKYTEEVKDFIAECFDYKEIEIEFGLYRFLGPLFRSFPEAMDDFSDKVKDLLLSKLTWFSQSNTPEQSMHQGAYLVLLVPFLNSSYCNISDFASTIPSLNKFLDRKTSFLKCQAQLVAQIFAEKGTEEMKSQIKASAAVKLREFGITLLDKAPNKLTSVSWKLMNTSLFSYFLVVPNDFINTMALFFVSIRQAINDQQMQTLSPKEVIDNITDMCSFISSGYVVDYLIEKGRYMEFAKYFANLFSTITFLPRIRFISILIDFFRFGKSQFPDFIRYALTNDESMQLLVVIASQDSSVSLIQSVEDEVIEDIKKALVVNERLTIMHTMLANFVTRFKRAKYDEEVINLLYIILQKLLDAFENNFPAYSCKGFENLFDFFCVNHAKMFMQFSFKILNNQNPMIVRQYAQHMSKLRDTQQPKITTEMLFSLEYSDNMNINSLFFTMFVVPFVTTETEKVEEVIDFISSKFDSTVLISFLNRLTDMEIQFDKSKYDPVKLYEDEKDCQEKIQILVFWSKNYPETEFMQLFNHFISYFGIFNYIPNEIKRMCEYLKIPKDLDEKQKEEICAKLNSVQKKHARAPRIVAYILKFINKNQEVFSNPVLFQFYYTIQDHALYIESSVRRHSKPSTSLFIELSRLITGKNLDKERFLANHLCSFASKAVFISKDSPDNSNIVNTEFPLMIVKLVRIQGLHISFANEILTIILELYKKTLQPQQTYSRMLQTLVKILPDIVQVFCKGSNFPLYESIVDLCISFLMLPSPSYFWSYAIKTISFMIAFPLYKTKVLEKLDVPEHDDQIAVLFPLLWKYPKNSKVRTNVLIPFAMKYCRIGTTELAPQVYYADKIMQTIIEYPYDSVMNIVLEQIGNAISKMHDYGYLFFTLRFLNQGFMTKRESPALKNILSNFMSVPKVAAQFFKNAPLPIRNAAMKQLSYEIKLTALYRIYPKLDKEVNEFIDQFPKEEILNKCKEIELWYIPFAYLVSSFFDITINDALKIVQYYQPMNNMKNIVKSLVGIDKVTKKSVTFVVGQRSVNTDIPAISWDEAQRFLGDDKFFVKEDIAPYPLLRFWQNYEVTEKEMAGYVPSIDFSVCRRVLEDSYDIAKYAEEYLQNQANIESVRQTIRDFATDVFRHVTKKDFRSFLVANEVLRFDTYFQDLQKSGISSVVFNRFVLSPSDPPKLHYTYKRIRELIQSITKDTEIKLDGNLIHEKILEESLRLNSPSVPDFRTADLIKASPNDVEALLCQLFSLSSSVDVNETILSSLKTCLVSGSPSDTTLSILYHLLDRISPIVTTISRKMETFSAKWAPFFARKIATDKNLVPMLALLPKSSNIILILKDSEIGIDVRRDVNTFIKPIQNIARSERLKHIKNSISVEKELSNAILSKKKVPARLINRANALQEDTVTESLLLGEYLVASISVPLGRDYMGNAMSLLIYLKSHEAQYANVQLLTTTGTKVNYILTYETPMRVKFAVFSQAFSSIFAASPSSAKRNIRLPSFSPLNIIDDMYLTKTDGEPYINSSVIQELIDAANNNPKESKRLSEEAHKYNSKKDVVEFYQNFAARFGALSLVQTCFGCESLSPFDLTLDISNYSIAAKTMQEKGTGKDPIFRLFGRAADFMDMPLVKGPFRGSFIAAADAVVNNTPKTRLFLRTLLQQESDLCSKFTSKAAEYSTRNGNTDEVQEKINALIKASVEVDESKEITWI